MVQFSKSITFIPNKKTTSSAVDIAGYGLYTAFVDTKKGPQTPVRRSCRGAKRSPYYRDKNTLSSPMEDDEAEKWTEKSIHHELDSDDDEGFSGSLYFDDCSECEDETEEIVEETLIKVDLDDHQNKTERNLEEARDCTVVDEEDLCATFEVKLTIGKNDLKVKKCTASLVSPKPQFGRCITVKEVGSNPIQIFSPVVRSSRNSLD